MVLTAHYRPARSYSRHTCARGVENAGMKSFTPEAVATIAHGKLRLCTTFTHPRTALIMLLIVLEVLMAVVQSI